MAEYVQFRIEETIPELEEMSRIKLFERHEVRAIANKRKQLEYKTERKTKCKEDYLRYIQYEVDLLKLIKLRRTKTRIFYKQTEIDYAIKNRVNGLFRKVVQRFQSDVKLWISHINFCTQVGFKASVSDTLVRMLHVHSDKPNLWKLAANWEFDENCSMENARKFLLHGLRFHPESKTIYKEAFHMELKFADEARQAKAEEEEKARAIRIENEEPELKTTEPVNPILEGRLAEIIYDSAVGKINNVKFSIDLLNIAMEFDFASNLQNKIIDHLLKSHRNDELVWDFLARRALLGYQVVELSDETSEISVAFTRMENQLEKEKVIACVDVYVSALKNLKTEKMWSLYLDLLMELNQDVVRLPKMKQKLLSTGFIEAHSSGFLREQYYLQWEDLLRSNGSKSKVISVLELAVERYPNNVDLWHRYLRCHLDADCEATVLDVFERALATLGKHSNATVALWSELIQYYQSRDESKTEEWFERAVVLGTQVSLVLKPIYLDWLLLVRGIEAARNKYQLLCLVPPLCVELHMKMAELECSQSEVNKKYARKCYNLACHEFGNNNYDLWLKYVRFELEKGDAKLVCAVYNNAIKSLDGQQVESFVAEFSLIKSGTLTPMDVS